MLNNIFLFVKKIIYNFLSFIVIKKSLSKKDVIKYYDNDLIYYSNDEDVFLSNSKYFLIGNIYSNFVKDLNKIIKIPKPFVLNLKKSWIVGKKDRTPIFLDSKHRAILESCNSLTYYLYYSGAIIEIFFSRIINKKNLLKNVINITGTMTNNSFHWLVEYLPRLELFYEKVLNDDYYLLIDNKPTKFQIETLKLLNIPSEKILKWNGQKTLCHDAFIPSIRHLNYSMSYQVYSKKAFDWVRLKLLNSIQNVPKKNTNIYISRRLSSTRRITNEILFKNYLSKFNFKFICLEDLSAKEIISYYRDAKIIIAVHGAALSHTLFSNNCSIIEIFPSNFKEVDSEKPNHICLSSFYQISSLYQFNHYTYVVEGKDKFDVDIDLNKFSQFFESKILNESSSIRTNNN